MFFETDNLSVGYAGKVLIHDINISVEKGKILTLIGPNGSGKSTILKTITKHLDKIGGIVAIDNSSIAKWSNKELAKKLSVMLTERIDPELMTCGEVVAMGRYPFTNHFGKLLPHDKTVVDESLEMVHASELADRPFCDISDGQRQRIMLARAICQEPEIIVLDEPTSYLDIRHKVELLDILRTMASEKNVAVIMSLHEIDLAAKISDFILCVKGEQIELCGTPEEVFTGECISRLYDMESGSFNPLFGSVELSAVHGEPKVFVLAGGGVGILAFRLLQKHNLAFATGILFDNDVDYEVARTLSQNVIDAPAFMPIRADQLRRAKALIDQTECFLNTGVVIGTYNAPQQELIEYARAQGKRMFDCTNELIEALA